MSQYFKTGGDALSQLVNAWVFRSGNANESLSGRCWNQREHWFFGRLRPVIDQIFVWFGEEDHCEKSYWRDVARAEALLMESLKA